MATLRVEELMTPTVICVPETGTLAEAEERMLQTGVRHLPVVDAQQRLVGILSERDLARAAGHPGGQGRPLADVMSRQVLTVQPETPAHEAAELMIERRISALPVVDEQHRLLGIVTDMDFLTVARNALQGRLGWQLTQA